MNQTIEQRMQAVENELKEIRKELEESLARYKTSFLKPLEKPTCHWSCTGCDICGSKSHGDSWY